jgi:dolichol-phosphate mannosyltransferase
MVTGISVVVPLFNEELVIDEMYRRLSLVLGQTGMDWEIVLVDDGSRDRTVELARAICAREPRVRLVCLSRNFGHQIAISAGMEWATGQCVVVIDADLQDPPEVIPAMLKRWREGCEVVYGVRTRRAGETWFKLATAKVFYRMLRRMTAVDIPVDTGDFRLLDRRVVDHLIAMPEHARFVRGMVSWIGFRQGQVEYERDARFAGETKYPFRKMLRFATDGVLSFSQVPLKLASAFGFLSAAVSFGVMAYGLGKTLLYPQFVVPGWASTFTATLFVGGVQLICLGILGEYVGRIYDEVKRRPLYIVGETVNVARAARHDGGVDASRAA